MKVTVISIVIGKLGTLSKGLVRRLEELEIGGQIKTIQTTPLLRFISQLKKVQETCCHSDSSERPPANAGVNNLLGIE